MMRTHLSAVRLLVLATSLFGVIGCRNEAPPATARQGRPLQQPTATEVFNLRSSCEALAKVIEADNNIGPALTQSHTSHYNPRTNRCYVQLDILSADVSIPPDRAYSHSLVYDGQTREILVSLTNDRGKELYFVDEGGFTRERALARIQQLMEDDRTQ